jgi:carbon storage regulator CsrA
MLVLSRKPGEGMTIGKAGDVLTEPIVVKCVQITPGRTRLGFVAPSNIKIVRAELEEPDESPVGGGSFPVGGREMLAEDLGASVLARQLRGEEP